MPQFLVACFGPLALLDGEPRQIRKEATVIIDAGARCGEGGLPPHSLFADMDYQVLARKWRPQLFTDLLGQSHVSVALTHALHEQRLHHAYLFTGTRGVGKTTIARILARCLNCEQGVTANPCGECGTCQAILAGRFPDLLEIDAASRTKVEDTRELLDNVQYLPAQGRYKIYLIDEVHMLSGHSFNALLKTLEEPPSHVKFLLATTDPQKLPVTILSRCLQFHLKAITPEQLQPYLQRVLQAEAIAYEEGALHAVARAANGSVRDALSLLEQAIALGGGAVQTVATENMLGLVADARVFALLSALAARDAAALSAEIKQLAELAVDFDAVLVRLLELLHQLALQQFLPVTETETTEARLLAELAAALHPEEIQLLYQMGLMGRRDLAFAPTPQLGFEMTLLRMLAFAPVSPGVSDRAPSQPASKPIIPTPHIQSHHGPAKTVAAAPASDPIQPPAMAAPQPPAPPAAARVEDIPPVALSDNMVSSPTTDWASMVQALGLAGMAGVLAKNCVLQRIDTHEVRLSLSPQHAPLCNKAVEARLGEALSRYLKRPIKLVIAIEAITTETPAAQQGRQSAERLQAASVAMSADPTVQALMDTFSAEIVPDSIRVVSSEPEAPAS